LVSNSVEIATDDEYLFTFFFFLLRRVNKDCRAWAKKHLTEKLVGISASENNVRVSITSLDECTGDVDLNQRKGKLLAMYDVALKLGWQGN
jgi:activator of HSP90 ATPase